MIRILQPVNVAASSLPNPASSPSKIVTMRNIFIILPSCYPKPDSDHEEPSQEVEDFDMHFLLLFLMRFCSALNIIIPMPNIISTKPDEHKTHPKVSSFVPITLSKALPP